MKVTTEKPEPGVTTLTVELPSEDFDQAVDQAWKRVAGRVNIPGFRRGKAPRPLVERHVGQGAIDEEAIRVLLPRRYDAAVEETGIAPIERPTFDIVQMERGKPLVFTATVAVRPTVELGDYKSITIQPDTAEVREDEIERVIERLQETQAQWVPVEDRGLDSGDMAIADVTIQFEGDDTSNRTSERKDTELVVGQSGYPAGFDEQVTGIKPGETKTFTLSWQIGPGPNDPGGEEGKEAERRSASFTVSVKEVKRKQLPELDDEFAKSLGEHETLAALREDVSKRLADEALRAARSSTENKAVEAAVQQATFEIPQRLVELETQSLVEDRERSMEAQRLTLQRYLQLIGQSEEDFRAEMTRQAEAQIKARTLLDALAEKEEIEPTPEEITEEIEETAQVYGEQSEQIRRQLNTDQARRRVETSIRRRKAIEKLVDYAGGYPKDVATTSVPASAGGEPAAASATEEPKADQAKLETTAGAEERG